MSGDGFGVAATRFFAELEDHNSREHWLAHADVYEREVREPMLMLLDALPPRYQHFRLFRMNRDLRFTTDKSPYKTQQAAIRESDDGIDHYLHLDADGLLVACGTYQMESDQLARFRPAVDDGRTGKGLERLLRDLEERGWGTDGMGVASLKTAPRGYPKDHPRIGLLRRKGVVGYRTLTGPALRDQAALQDFVVETLDACEPLARWLRRHVGPTAHRNEPGR